MATNTKEYVIQLSVDDSGAIKNIDTLDKSLAAGAKSATSVKAELRAIQQELAKFEQGSEEFNKLSLRAGELKDRLNDASEAIRANAGNAIETLSNNVGNLGNRFATLDFDGITQDFKGIAGSIGNIKADDLTKGIQGAGAAFAQLGKTLLSNPIFLIGAAIAAVVLNFDKLKEVLDLGVNPATRRLAEETRAAAEASKEAFDAFGLEERRLRALGVAEDEIAEKRKQATKERLASIKAARQAEAKLLQEQVAEFAKNWGQGLGLFGPSLDDIKESTARLAQLRKEEEEFSVQVLEIDKKITAGKKEESDKQRDNDAKALAERNSAAAAAAKERFENEKRLVELQRENALKVFEINKAVREKIKQLEDQSINDGLTKIISAEDEKFKRLEAQEALRLELLAEGQEKEIQIVDQKFIKLREQAFGNAELLKQLAEQNAQEVADIELKFAAQQKASQQSIIDFKIKAVQDSLNIITDLTEVFNNGSEKANKKAFQINKAAAIAQAIITTYLAAQKAYASQLIPVDPTSIVRAQIAAGIAIAGGLANVAKISKTQFKSGSPSGGGGGFSGGGGSGGGGGTASAGGGGGGAPTFNPVNTAFLNNRPPQATPAYVLSGAVTDAQVADQKIKEQARL